MSKETPIRQLISLISEIPPETRITTSLITSMIGLGLAMSEGNVPLEEVSVVDSTSFLILLPSIALLMFAVFDLDNLGDNN